MKLCMQRFDLRPLLAAFCSDRSLFNGEASNANVSAYSYQSDWEWDWDWDSGGDIDESAWACERQPAGCDKFGQKTGPDKRDPDTYGSLQVP